MVYIIRITVSSGWHFKYFLRTLLYIKYSFHSYNRPSFVEKTWDSQFPDAMVHVSPVPFLFSGIIRVPCVILYFLWTMYPWTMCPDTAHRLQNKLRNFSFASPDVETREHRYNHQVRDTLFRDTSSMGLSTQMKCNPWKNVRGGGT